MTRCALLLSLFGTTADALSISALTLSVFSSAFGFFALFCGYFCLRSLLQPIKCFLQNLDVARVIELSSSGLNPLSFQRIFSRTIDLVEHSKEPWEWQIS